MYSFNNFNLINQESDEFLQIFNYIFQKVVRIFKLNQKDLN